LALRLEEIYSSRTTTTTAAVAAMISLTPPEQEVMYTKTVPNILGGHPNI